MSRTRVVKAHHTKTFPYKEQAVCTGTVMNAKSGKDGKEEGGPKIVVVPSIA